MRRSVVGDQREDQREIHGWMHVEINENVGCERSIGGQRIGGWRRRWEIIGEIFNFNELQEGLLEDSGRKVSSRSKKLGET
ncbi:unnamed protein product [Hymenolepis diminuta]|uniref:Uncharacterized protein n=1 Tax=Hymenolepis diminuta TaxID=6216 RepID=A0A0R3SLN8_HYMDI|nr:unnamed protein product [Hymenolepis diminuta]